jgi:hypothetical protein
MERGTLVYTRGMSRSDLGISLDAAHCVLLARLLNSPLGIERSLLDPDVVAHLLDDGLVGIRKRRVVAGSGANMIEYCHLSELAWSDPQLLATLRKQPRTPHVLDQDIAGESIVPARFHHLFWNCDPNTLTIQDDGSFIGLRLLEYGDIESALWALNNIPAAQLNKITTIRGVEPRLKNTIRNWLAFGSPR